MHDDVVDLDPVERDRRGAHRAVRGLHHGDIVAFRRMDAEHRRVAAVKAMTEAPVSTMKSNALAVDAALDLEMSVRLRAR